MWSSVCPHIELLDDNQIVLTAAAHLAQFRLVPSWHTFIESHECLCESYKKQGSWDRCLLKKLADHLTQEQDELRYAMKALLYVCRNGNIVGLLGSTYNDLFLRFPTFNSTEHAFAVVLVQIAQTNLKRMEPPEEFGSSRHLAHAFHRPYRGDAPNRFLTFVSRVKEDTSGGFGPKPWYYGTSIVQSSGAGKTRMVYECQKLTPLLYVSFVSRGDDLPEPLDRYPRKNHFKDISDLAASKFAAVANTDPNNCFLLEGPFVKILTKPLVDLNEQLTAVSRHLRSAQEEAGVPSPPVLVVFDECIEMLAKQFNRGWRQFDSLRRAWKFFSLIEEQNHTLCFWLVLISTSIEAIHVPAHFDPSSRMLSTLPMPTFVGVGVNLLAEEQCALSCASQASSVDHLS
ncbi:hypothetical protein NDA10_001982 [Ustilago hordei]|nr:hypothetical protein NDA10_001982 [Ustilago hordei]